MSSQAAGWVNRVAELLSFWEIRTAVISSFVAHLVLTVLANIRRRQASGVLMLILWLVYQLSGWVAPFALTNLSTCDDGSRMQQQVGFWATFLLHHLGGPDNISAFSLEDSKLSGREALNVLSRVGGASYVLYKHVYLGGGGWTLILASIVIFTTGAVKYAERAWALWQGDLGNIRGPRKEEEQPSTSSRPLQHACAASRLRSEDSLLITGRDHRLKDEHIMMIAHDMLPFCRRAMADSSVEEVHDYDDLGKSRKIFTLQLENMCKVVEMELSLTYDIIYTKAAVVHTWSGYIIRVASPLAICSATVLLFFYNTEGQTIRDMIITYGLLLGTIILDMRWLLKALASTWTQAFLQSSSLCHEILCSGRWHRFRSLVVSLDLSRLRLASLPVSPSSYRRWSGTIGQYNLLHESTRKIGAWGRAVNALGFEDGWNEYLYSQGHKLSGDVKDLVFGRVRRILVSTYEEEPSWDLQDAYSMEEITTSWGQVTTKRRHKKLRRFRLAFGREFQEDILVWHIATQVFLSCRCSSDQSLVGNDKNAATHIKAIKALSDYLMFLATVRRHMLPGLVLRGLYGVTVESLQQIWGEGADTAGSISSSITAEHRLASKLFAKKIADTEWGFESNKTRLVSDAAAIAMELHSADSSEMPELLELVFKIWVDKLLYAASRSSPESHAKQLGRGGDLTTIVMLMVQHAGSFKLRSLLHGGTPGPDNAERL